MSISAVSGGDGSRSALVQGVQAQSAGSTAPSSDISEFFAGSGASPSADMLSSGSGLDSASSSLIADVQALLASLQSEASGGAAAGSGLNPATASPSASGTDPQDPAAGSGSAPSSAKGSSSPASSTGSGDPASVLGQIMQMLQAYGGQASEAGALGSMSSVPAA